MALAVCPLNMVVFPNKGFSKWGLFSQSIGYLSWPTCLGLGSLPSWAWGMPWLRVIAMVSLSTGDALNLAMWLCLGCFLVGVVMALEAKHMGMPCPWQRTHIALVACPLGRLFSQKRRFCSQIRVFGQANMQHSHGLGFGCLAPRCSLDLGYMPLPWLLPHCGFVNMHFGHAMA